VNIDVEVAIYVVSLFMFVHCKVFICVVPLFMFAFICVVPLFMFVHGWSPIYVVSLFMCTHIKKETVHIKILTVYTL
jgi:hypothetical protein